MGGQVHPERALAKEQVDARSIGARIDEWGKWVDTARRGNAPPCASAGVGTRRVERGDHARRITGAKCRLCLDEARFDTGGQTRRRGTVRIPQNGVDTSGAILPQSHRGANRDARITCRYEVEPVAPFALGGTKVGGANHPIEDHIHEGRRRVLGIEDEARRDRRRAGTIATGTNHGRRIGETRQVHQRARFPDTCKVAKWKVRRRRRKRGERAIALDQRPRKHLRVCHRRELRIGVVRIGQRNTIAEQFTGNRERHARQGMQVPDLGRPRCAHRRVLDQRLAGSNELRVGLREVVPRRIRKGVLVEGALVNVICAWARIDQLVGDESTIQVGSDVDGSSVEIAEVADGRRT